MDIADAWRTLRTNPADAPRAGAHLETAGQSITTTITQECVVALPRASYSPDLVTITVTSLRPGVAGHVTVGANLNSPDGSYQGPTTTASSLPLARRSLSTSLSCPGQAFPYSASTPKLIGQTGRHKASPSIMCYLSAIRGYGGGGRVGSSIF